MGKLIENFKWKTIYNDMYSVLEIMKIGDLYLLRNGTWNPEKGEIASESMIKLCKCEVDNILANLDFDDLDWEV